MVRFLDVTAISLWPLSVSVTVSFNVSRHVAPAAPVHDSRTLALEPDTFTDDAFAWPMSAAAARPGAGAEAVVSV